MTTRGRIPLSLVCCTVAFLGCSITQRMAWLSPGLRSEGALQLIERDIFEPINLVALLDPKNERSSKKATSSDGKIEIEQAFAAFYEDKNELELRRNRVQERLLAASNQRCNEYKQFIKQINTQTGFILGSLATTLAGVGAILTPASTVRALAGSAAITSGIRAEFQQDYFANLAVEVITKGIDARRKAIYEEILKRREAAKDIKEYPVKAAVKDAIFYHGACGLLAGLEEAGTSIERARDPGLNTLNEMFEENELIHRLTFGNRESITRDIENKLSPLSGEISKIKNYIESRKETLKKTKEDVDKLPNENEKKNLDSSLCSE